jgi:hypothetical protein
MYLLGKLGFYTGTGKTGTELKDSTPKVDLIVMN